MVTSELSALKYPNLVRVPEPVNASKIGLVISQGSKLAPLSICRDARLDVQIPPPLEVPELPIKPFPPVPPFWNNPPATSMVPPDIAKLTGPLAPCTSSARGPVMSNVPDPEKVIAPPAAGARFWAVEVTSCRVAPAAVLKVLDPVCASVPGSDSVSVPEETIALPLKATLPLRINWPVSTTFNVAVPVTGPAIVITFPAGPGSIVPVPLLNANVRLPAVMSVVVPDCSVTLFPAPGLNTTPLPEPLVPRLLSETMFKVPL